MPPTTPPPYDEPQPYEQSLLRLNVDAGRVRELRPDPGLPASAPLQPVRRLSPPIWVFTAWNPNGRPTSLDHNWTAHQQLKAVLRRFHHDHTRAAILAPDLSWAEQAVAVSDLSATEALSLLERFEQPVAWRWDNDGLTLLHADGTFGSPVPVTAVLRLRRPCPMQADQEADGLCTRPGGPWTSGSIAAAWEFTWDRTVLLTALGDCDTCHGGPVLGSGGRPLSPWIWSCASRYAPPQVLG